MKNKNLLRRVFVSVIAPIMLIYNFTAPSEVLNRVHNNTPKTSISQPGRLESRLQEKFYKNLIRDKIAVLVSTTPDRLTEIRDLNYAYKFLSSSGYEIYTLTQDGKDYHNLKVDGRLTAQNLGRLLNYLSNRVDEKDLLFVYITGHGRFRRVPKFQRDLLAITLPDSSFIETTFDYYFSKINPQEGIVLFDLCCAGDFVNNFDRDNYAITCGGGGDVYHLSPLSSTYGRKFIDSYPGHKGDKNKDGRVTLDEALDYASKAYCFESIIPLKKTKPLVKSDLDLSQVSLE